MKKIMAILALVIMMLSVLPSALGQDANADNEDLKTQLQIKAKKDAFVRAMQSKEDARAQIKAKLANARDEWRETKNTDDEQAKFKKAKAFMLSLIDKLEANFEHLLAKFEANGKLESNSAVKIKERLEMLSEVREQVEAAVTMDELKIAAKKLKQEWAHSRVESKMHIAKLATAKLEKALTAVERIAFRLDAKVDSLKEAGKETEDLESAMKTAFEKIESAKRNFEASIEASSQLDEELSAEESSALYTKSKKYLNLATDDLVKAKHQLRKVTVAIGAQNE